MTRILFRLVAMALFFAPLAAHATCSSLSTTYGNSVALAWGWNNANSAYQPLSENSDCTIGAGGSPSAPSYTKPSQYTPIAGSQYGLSVTTATGLTVPTGALYATIAAVSDTAPMARQRRPQ
jgi:hypothetical protein